MKHLISVVIPCYNEQESIESLFSELQAVIQTLPAYDFEYVFVDDGSSDRTLQIINDIAKKIDTVRLVSFSRNFGKEMATTAGIEQAHGQAIIIIDADGQHPPELIPTFVKKWIEGANVVVGVRTSNKGEGFIKKYGSKLFYKIFNKWSGTQLVPGSTDFRLIDSNVRSSFLKLKEGDRITRALIDWVGYQRVNVPFKARQRFAGEASYSSKKLVALAFNSFTSMSLTPLYLIGYLGIFVMFIAFCLGIFSLIEQIILNDPLGINITGSAFIGIFILFLVGMLLLAQGIISIYIAKIFKETKNRPLYIIDESRSINL